MVIRKLTATFGRLQHAELELQDGLNLITAPNESGKTTWSTLIAAMFYGLDPARSRSGMPAEKQKYMPWSGDPMEGTAEIEVNGKRITLERSGTKDRPMSMLRAYETETGLPVNLTAENCGTELLGCERSVFERSAFIRQASAAVSGDAALERRLQSLVTAGEETVSYTEIKKALEKQQHALQYNKTGKIPAAEAELAERKNKLERIHRIHAEETEQRACRSELLRRQETLQQELRAAEQRALRTKRRQLTRLREEASAAQTEAEQFLEKTQTLPREAELYDAQEALVVFKSQASFSPPVLPEPPDIPDVFSGMTPAEAEEKAVQDTERYRILANAPEPSRKLWLPVLSGVLLVAFPVLLLLCRLPLAWILLPFGAAGIVFWRMQLRKQKRRVDAVRAEAEELLASYGVSAPEAMRKLAADYRTDWMLYRQKEQEVRTQQEAHASTLRVLNRKLASVQKTLQTEDPVLLEARINDALTAYDSARTAQQAAEAKRQSYRTALDLVGDVPEEEAGEPESEADLGDSGPSVEAVANALAETNTALQSVQSVLDRDAGILTEIGEPAVLFAEKEAIERRLEAMRNQYASLTLALEALDHANEQLQRRFSPQLNREAASILSELTGGAYQQLILDADWNITAKKEGDLLSHDLAYLSTGTADQVYFAVRMAIARLLLPQETPLLFDDALVMFDDTRMDAAMRFLQKESENRQILLFSCQEREAAWLAQHRA